MCFTLCLIKHTNNLWGRYNLYFIDEETYSEKLSILPDFRTSVLAILFLQDASEVRKDLAGTRLVVEGASPL